MPEDSESEGSSQRSGADYLPLLTWALLGLLCVWFVVWFLFQRPTGVEERRVESFRRALRYVPAYYLYEVEKDRLYEAAMEGMMDSLEDRYSDYVPPGENKRLQEETKGEFGGIGVRVTAQDGLPLVVEVDEEGPAGRAGVREKDLITHVEGEGTADLSLREVVDRIRGEVGTPVRLTLMRPAVEESFQVSLERARISIPNVNWEMLPNDIAYLRLRSFDRNCAEEVQQALGEIQEKEAAGVLLDLRDNAGGLMKQGLSVADAFLDGGVMVRLKGRVEGRLFRADSEVALKQEVPLVVLVNRMTASASEILAGALQANGRATVVGTRTQGKGTVTELLSLPDGGGLNLAVARYQLADERIVEETGIQPDIVVGELPPPPRDDPEEVKAWLRRYEQTRREQKKRAIELLEGKIASE